MGKRKPDPKPAPKIRGGERSRVPAWLAPVLALSLLAFAVYANTLANGFVTDDKIQLLKNSLVTDFREIPEIFRSGVWTALAGKSNYYRPIQILVYMLLYYAVGFDAFGFHLFMVLLHAGNVVLVYFLTRQLLSQPVPRAPVAGEHSGPALAAAVLFAVHPIHTEVVDWIAALPDATLTALVMFAFWSFLRQGGSPRRLQIAGHCGFYLLALLSKETGAMLLPLYAGFEWICLGRTLQALRRNALLYGGMLATFGFYAILRCAALGGFAPTQQTFYRLRPGEFFASVVVTAAQYFGKLLFPAPLSYFHVFEPARTLTPAFLISLVVIFVLAAVMVRFRWRAPSELPVPRLALVSYGIFWMAMTIAPALNLTGVGPNVFAERYLYLPSVGFAWIAGLAWHWWALRKPQWAWPVALVILAACSVEVVSRNADWRDDLTLLEVTIRQSPGAAVLHNMLANAYVERDNPAQALEEERLATEQDPGVPLYHLNLGNLLLGQDPRAAIREFETTVKLEPSSDNAHYYLGRAWKAAGDSNMAAAEYERALAISANHAGALMALSEIYRDAGKIQEAIGLCRRAAAAKPRDPEPYIKLSVLSNDSGQYSEAIRAARKAIEIGPDSDRAYVAHYTLGIAYSHIGSLEAAASEFGKAYQLRPEFQQARDAYESALSKLKQARGGHSQ